MRVRNLYQSTRALLNRKLGACPKCMASSIVGSGLSWLALAILYAIWPNRLALGFGLTVAVAFTVLMITHVVVHMFRAAPVVRNLPGSRGSTQKSRREFALAVASSGFSFAAAALVSLPLIPKLATAKGKAASTFAPYCVGSGCATSGNGNGKGIDVRCLAVHLALPPAVYCVPCSGTAPSTVTCSNKGCSGTFAATLELIGDCGTCQPTPATSLPRGFTCV